MSPWLQSSLRALETYSFALLRADAFVEFYTVRRTALLALVERAMGKASAEDTGSIADDDEEEYDSDGAGEG